MLGNDHIKLGDTIIGVNDIYRAFRGGRCFKVAATFFCADDVAELFKTGCFKVHKHDKSGHNVLSVCGADFVHLLYGDVVNINGHHLKAHFSSDFNDYSHECVQEEPNHFVCWKDVEPLYTEDQECALYGNSWLCYAAIRHAWSHGSCVTINGMDVCDKAFFEVAQRKCATLSDGKTYCPTAYGMRTPKHEDLVHDHLASKQGTAPAHY